MMNKIKEAFTSEGLFLDKKISLHLTLQKGRENEKKLGSFHFDAQGCSNIARKLTLIFLVTAVYCCFAWPFFKKTKNIFR